MAGWLGDWVTGWRRTHPQTDKGAMAVVVLVQAGAQDSGTGKGVRA